MTQCVKTLVTKSNDPKVSAQDFTKVVLRHPHQVVAYEYIREQTQFHFYFFGFSRPFFCIAMPVMELDDQFSTSLASNSLDLSPECWN